MNNADVQNPIKIFASDYWREEGGIKWVDNIDKTEASIEIFNEQLFRQIILQSGDTILDVGCGGGLTSMELARLAGPDGRVTGVDVSPPILAVAKRRGAEINNLNFIEADAATDDLGVACYDLIFSRFGVMFFSDRKAAFTNLVKALKPTGKMVFLCWRTLEENPWMGEPNAAIFSILPPLEKPDPDGPGPFSLADAEKIRQVLVAAGLENIEIKPVDVLMELGSMTEAVQHTLQTGPATAVLADATDRQREAAAEAVTAVFGKYLREGKVSPPAAAWLVTAS